MSSPYRHPSSPRSRPFSTKHAAKTLVHHLQKHVGLGIVCAVAYFDPGNWSVDLQAGADFGYRPMLFVLLLSGLGAIVLQTMSCRLGCVTGIDLASHCRLLLHDHPKHPKLVRRAILYPLYVCAEIAIISTDLAELLGSAVGLSLLFPKLPLWTAVLLTAFDVLIFLFFADPSRGEGRPVRLFEFIIMGLVLTVFVCFVVLLVKVNPDWPNVFLGYIPSKGLFQAKPDAVYAAVGILGATIMPHALFLGSYLATHDRVSEAPVETVLPGPVTSQSPISRLKTSFVNLFKVSSADRAASSKDYRSKYGERENNSLSFVRLHLNHNIVDIVTSLSLVALPINSAILILAATVFFNKPDFAPGTTIGLFDAHDLIKTHIGSGSAIVFALALICAGQTSSITATLAGQVVSEGFIEWRVSPFLRRLITRLIGLVPSVAVAVAVGKDGIDKLLVASQVILSVVLPFVAFPLIYLTSSTMVMRVRNPETPSVSLSIPSRANSEMDSNAVEKVIVHQQVEGEPERLSPTEVTSIPVTVPAIPAIPPATLSSAEDSSSAGAEPISKSPEVVEGVEDPAVGTASNQDSIPDSVRVVGTLVEPIKDETYLDFALGRVMTTLAYMIWAVILVANAYAIVMLALGQT
ncbi:Nramp-domain-containing protein [Dendrothele bispora CBS 962.96]|uniref:Nramp-domain-containing protein n=1 Tax=Dendrothele bispora (strain CBS 962.96) TaxID=1314807 RepID=A0A4S8MSF2_DENBC|nr:Nramp-domain-containing protein [Dendrothele bispora CBS 962.96]